METHPHFRVASKPYQLYDIEPEKLECVGHIQKRIGTRLRARRKEKHGGQKLTGKGKLTGSAVNTIQNYFGMAIRSAASDANMNEAEKVYQMKNELFFFIVQIFPTKRSAMFFVLQAQIVGASGKKMKMMEMEILIILQK